MLAQGWSSGECQRLKSDIYLILTVMNSTAITNFPQETLLSETLSLRIFTFTILLLCELFTLSLSCTLTFGAVTIFVFTSL